MAKRESFTAGRVAGFALETGKKQTFFWCGKTPGLGVRVTSGSKAYVFETSMGGKTLRITIGDVRTWSLGDVQARVRELKAMTDKGIDPRQVKAEAIARAEAQRAETRLTQDRHFRHGTPAFKPSGGKWSARHLSDHENLSKPGGEVSNQASLGVPILVVPE